jgi:hypothetical protein
LQATATTGGALTNVLQVEELADGGGTLGAEATRLGVVSDAWQLSGALLDHDWRERGWDVCTHRAGGGRDDLKIKKKTEKKGTVWKESQEKQKGKDVGREESDVESASERRRLTEVENREVAADDAAADGLALALAGAAGAVAEGREWGVEGWGGGERERWTSCCRAWGGDGRGRWWRHPGKLLKSRRRQ